MVYLFAHIVCIIFIFLSPSAYCALHDTECATIYNTAGTLYREGHFHEALALYDSLITQEIKDPDLLYNASNAAYRTGSLGRAILYLERSLNLAPSDRDARDNLAFLNNQKQDKDMVHSNVIISFISQRYNALNVNDIALLSGISFTLALICWTLFLFVQRWKRMLSIIIAGLACFVFLISTSILIEKIYYNATVVEAVITSGEANAYSGPGKENTHIFTLHEGTKVVIERSQDSWNLIRLQSGAGGWIKADSMERI